MVSLDSATKRHDSWGYVAELVYTFEVVQYLKGDGADELFVRMSSGPKYIAFPDWLGERTESEAIELADRWLGRSINIIDNKRDAILLFDRAEPGEYYFRSTEDDESHIGYPAMGTTWLVEVKPSIYRHRFMDGQSGTISLSDFNSRIEDMRSFMEGDHALCIAMALHYRTRVRDQLVGVYRELTLGGYREPEPFPRYMAAGRFRTGPVCHGVQIPETALSVTPLQRLLVGRKRQRPVCYRRFRPCRILLRRLAHDPTASPGRIQHPLQPVPPFLTL